MTNTQNLAWFTDTKVYSLLHFFSCNREKETEYDSWVDRISWRKRKNILWKERVRERERVRKKVDTKLKFSFWFSVAVLTFLLANSFSTSACLVWDLFSDLNPKWGLQTSSFFTLPFLVFNWLSLPRHALPPSNLQNIVASIFPPGVGGKNIPVYRGSTMRKRFKTIGFFSNHF